MAEKVTNGNEKLVKEYIEKCVYDREFRIATHNLKEAFRGLLPCCLKDEEQPHLNGICISQKHGIIRFVATDKKRMGVFRIQNNGDDLEDFEAIIPAEACKLALKIFGGIKNKEILITVGINAITFACDKEPFVEFTYELMKLNYIDWENVYPQEKKAIACVNSSYVEKAFKAIGGKQTNIHITDESQPIVLRPIEKDIEKNIEFLIMPITTLDEPEEVK